MNQAPLPGMAGHSGDPPTDPVAEDVGDLVYEAMDEDDQQRARPRARKEPSPPAEAAELQRTAGTNVARVAEEERRDTRRERTMTSGVNGLPPIKVVGVGGGGCNAINRMISAEVSGVQYVGVNTDAQALARCEAGVRIRIGDKLTKGLGAGGDPDKGEMAAQESREELLDTLRGAEMVFITAGMGGGTGTGASPVVAEVAREVGALTVAIVTKPFSFEGQRRRQQAEEGSAELRDHVDTLIVIPNDRLLDVCGPEVTVEEAFRAADDVLRQGIQGIAELITLPGEINLDFADVRRIMEDAGPALLAIGRASGENRAVEAAKAAISSPLLDVTIDGARGVLYNVTGARNLGLHELHAAAQAIAEVVSPDAEIIFGTAIDPSLGDEVKVTVIATGFPTGPRPLTAESPAVEQHYTAEAPANPADTELPAFLRRTVAMR
jgi:cell division protein FtsZ